MQKDLKRLVAYGTVAGVGFIVIGLFGFTTQGITGGIVEMVNHGLSTGALFLLVGMVWERRRTYRFSELGGLQSVARPRVGVHGRDHERYRVTGAQRFSSASFS